jgi:hypothetical protein
MPRRKINLPLTAAILGSAVVPALTLPAGSAWSYDKPNIESGDGGEKVDKPDKPPKPEPPQKLDLPDLGRKDGMLKPGGENRKALDDEMKGQTP